MLELMAYNFLMADRDQQFLMPLDLRDWLPADHLAWFIIDVVEQLDLSVFRTSYRPDGHGRAAYDPAVVVAVLLYAYCLGLRSSRVIERRCREDIAFRVLAGNLTPDHVTFARFRQRHEYALAACFVESLRLCAEAGMVNLGVVALDGTKVAADASLDANRTLVQIEAEVAAMLAEAQATDEREDARHGPDRGDELPAALADSRSRLARLTEAKARLKDKAAKRRAALEARQAESDATAAAKGRAPKPLRPKPRSEAPQPDAKANITDPDSRIMRAPGTNLQGYNAQVVCTPEQVIVAAEVTTDINDVLQLEPMVRAMQTNLGAVGVDDEVGALVADAGYWRAANVDGSITELPELYIPVARHGRAGKPRKDGLPSASRTDHLREAMRTKLDTDEGRALYKLRTATVEPVIGQIKEARATRRFRRRGLSACVAEWRLICATHNLLKLWRHQLLTAG